MAERKQKITMEESMRRMAQTDPRTVNRDTLVDIRDVNIRTELDDRERMLDFIRQIKNPYCYLDNGMVVKISFSGKKPLQECMKEYIF